MNFSESVKGLSGVEQLRLLMVANPLPPIFDTMKFTLLEVEEGRVVIAGRPGLFFYNPIGSVHGGYAATLLDSACGCAVHSRLSPGQAYTTLEIKVSYIRGMSEATGEIRAEGKVISFGRRTSFAEARIVDRQNKTIATATSTLLVMNEPVPS